MIIASPHDGVHAKEILLGPELEQHGTSGSLEKEGIDHSPEQSQDGTFSGEEMKHQSQLFLKTLRDNYGMPRLMQRHLRSTPEQDRIMHSLRDGPKENLMIRSLRSGPDEDLLTRSLRSGASQDLMMRSLRSGAGQDLMMRSLRNGAGQDLMMRSLRNGVGQDLMIRSLRGGAGQDLMRSGVGQDLMMRSLRQLPRDDIMTRSLRSPKEDLMMRSLRSGAGQDLMMRSLRDVPEDLMTRSFRSPSEELMIRALRSPKEDLMMRSLRCTMQKSKRPGDRLIRVLRSTSSNHGLMLNALNQEESSRTPSQMSSVANIISDRYSYMDAPGQMSRILLTARAGRTPSEMSWTEDNPEKNKKSADPMLMRSFKRTPSYGRSRHYVDSGLPRTIKNRRSRNAVESSELMIRAARSTHNNGRKIQR